MTEKRVLVIGGGLAGSEAAWQAAEAGVDVSLYEMRPHRPTPAHTSDRLAELVCSNSLGSMQPNRAGGLLKAELRGLGSLILRCAEANAVPAGSSLAVDRDGFAAAVTAAIAGHPRITLVREEVTRIPDGPVIIASGPLTAEALAGDIGRFSGRDHLYFFDALSPIIEHDSIDFSVAFRQSRRDDGELADGDYINCPMTREEYERFVAALLSAETAPLREFETQDARFFEGCMPVEVLAARGSEALRFGPLRPVGLIDPRTGKRPWAVVQLRQDNVAGSLYNLVGFQTNLRWGIQAEVLRLIPGLGQARFVRLGQMHRNTYINAPHLLHPSLQTRRRSDLFFAGQIVGAEGYVGNAGTGLLAGLNAARLIQGEHPLILPTQTMLGALCHYVTHADAKSFQPMKANFGLFGPPPLNLGKQDRFGWYANRSLTALRRFARDHALAYDRAAAEREPVSADSSPTPP
jgi:methylenetetrahydrofolate--tRNA-(uracil-5-)-methyltransferase